MLSTMLHCCKQIKKKIPIFSAAQASLPTTLACNVITLILAHEVSILADKKQQIITRLFANNYGPSFVHKLFSKFRLSLGEISGYATDKVDQFQSTTFGAMMRNERQFRPRWQLPHALRVLNKGKDPLLPDRYRPITLLNTIAKLKHLQLLFA